MHELRLSSGESLNISGIVDTAQVEIDATETSEYQCDFNGFSESRRRGNKLLCRGYQGRAELIFTPLVRGNSADASRTERAHLSDVFGSSFKIFVTLVLTTVSGVQYRVELPDFNVGGRSRFDALGLETRGEQTMITAAHSASAVSADRSGNDVIEAVSGILGQTESGHGRSHSDSEVVILRDVSISSQQAFEKEFLEAIGTLLTGLIGSSHWILNFGTSSHVDSFNPINSGSELSALLTRTGAVNEVGWTRDYRSMLHDQALLIISDSAPAWVESYSGPVHAICAHAPISPTRASVTVFDESMLQAVQRNESARFASEIEKMDRALRGVRS